MKKIDLFIRFILIPLILNILIFFVSHQEFFRRGFTNRYVTSWNLLDTINLYYFSESDILYSNLIVIGFIISLIILIIQSTRAIMFAGFPSIKEAKFYYRELFRIKRAARAIKEKERLEIVRQNYKLKLEKLEAEKKKYL